MLQGLFLRKAFSFVSDDVAKKMSKQSQLANGTVLTDLMRQAKVACGQWNCRSNYWNLPLNHFAYHFHKPFVEHYNGANSCFSFLYKKRGESRNSDVLYAWR